MMVRDETRWWSEIRRDDGQRSDEMVARDKRRWWPQLAPADRNPVQTAVRYAAQQGPFPTENQAVSALWGPR